MAIPNYENLVHLPEEFKTVIDRNIPVIDRSIQKNICQFESLSSTNQRIAVTPTYSQPKEEEETYSVNLSINESQMLEDLAAHYGVTTEDAIRLAIGTEFYLQKEILNGGTILVRKRNGNVREVAFSERVVHV